MMTLFPPKKNTPNPMNFQPPRPEKRLAQPLLARYIRPKVWQFLKEQDELLNTYAPPGYPIPETPALYDAEAETLAWEHRRVAMRVYREHLMAELQQQPSRQEAAQAYYATHILGWFRDCATTFDPRPARTGERRLAGTQPFVLYPFQAETVLRLNEAIETGQDILIEKSRDMGLSWLVCGVFVYRWLYHPGQQFLIGSRNHATADARGDLSSLMEKCRFILRELPTYWQPRGFDWRKHDVNGKLLHPGYGNFIGAEAATENFARGGRYTAILMDEFAFWPQASASYASAGQATYCRCVVSTPDGTGNRFYVERAAGLMDVLTLHWVMHPLKDDAWYARECSRMLRHEIARELNIDYTYSAKDRVFEEFDHRVHVAEQLKPDATQPIVRVWDFGFHTPAVLFMQVDAYGRLNVFREVVGERILLEPFIMKVKAESLAAFGPEAHYTDYCDAAGHQHGDKSAFSSVELLYHHGIQARGVRCGVKESLDKTRHLMIEERQVPLPQARTPYSLRDLQPLYDTWDAAFQEATALAREGHGPGVPENLLERQKFMEQRVGFHLCDGLPSRFRPAFQMDAEGCPTLLEALAGGYRYKEVETETPAQEHPYEDVVDCLRYGTHVLAQVLGSEKSVTMEQQRIREIHLFHQARREQRQQRNAGW
jgi:hypothetical protein